MHWYFDAFKRYAIFDGRATREEYWSFQVINFLAMMVLAIAGELVGFFGVMDGLLPKSNGDNSIVYGIVGLYFIASFLPNLAVSVRRLHDTGKSGWWILVGFIPYIGWLVQVIYFVLDSQPDRNVYGPNPKNHSTSTIVAD